jgi:hypothetical protein
VLTGGGGICGSCQTAGYLRRDFEIFTPPYLYLHDGSGQLAPRPTLSGAPAILGYDGTFTLTSPEAASIAKLALVRLGSPTHSQDQSQRYVPLTFAVSGTTITATAPNNPAEAPAGPYMLFAVDAAGVPSTAPIVSLQRATAATPPPVNLALGRAATGSSSCTSNETPAKAVNGSVSGGLSDKFCTKVSGTRYLRVDLGTSRSVNTFVVKHAGAGGESAALNTRNYRVETRTGTSGSWSTAVTVTGNTANVTTSTITARNARQVRLVVTRSEQGTAAGAARIYELEIYSGTPAPSSAPAVLYAGQNATGRAQRFQAGAYDVQRGNLGVIGNDLARSLDVAAGYQATLCPDPGLTGTCTTLAAGRHNTLPAGIDLAVSSLRVRAL